MAKEILHSRKAISRIATNMAQLMSVNNALVEQLGAGAAAPRWRQDMCLGQRTRQLLHDRRDCSRSAAAAAAAAAARVVQPHAHVACAATLPNTGPSRCCTPVPAAMLKVAQTLGKSTEVMKLVNQLMKMPEMQKTMVEMSKGAGPLHTAGGTCCRRVRCQPGRLA